MTSQTTIPVAIIFDSHQNQQAYKTLNSFVVYGSVAAPFPGSQIQAWMVNETNGSTIVGTPLHDVGSSVTEWRFTFANPTANSYYLIIVRAQDTYNRVSGSISIYVTP